MIPVVATQAFKFDGKMRQVDEEFSMTARDAKVFTLARKVKPKDGSDQTYMTRHLEASNNAAMTAAKRGRGRPAGSPNKPKDE